MASSARINAPSRERAILHLCSSAKLREVTARRALQAGGRFHHASPRYNLAQRPVTFQPQSLFCTSWRWRCSSPSETYRYSIAIYSFDRLDESAIWRPLAAEKPRIRHVGDHLVQIHVRLRPRSRLPHDEWEMIVQTSLDHPFAAARIALASRGSSRPSRSFTVAAAYFTMANDRTIATGIFSPPILNSPSPLRLRPPQPVAGHANLAHGVRLDAANRRRRRRRRPEPSDTLCATNRPDDAEDDGSASGRMSSTNRSANGIVRSRRTARARE